MSASKPIQKFGDPTIAFEIKTLKSLILQAKTPDDLREAKYYLLSYFMLYSSPHGVFMWRPDIQNFEHKLLKEINMLIRSVKRVFYKPSTNPEAQPERIEFDIAKWFLKGNALVTVAYCDPTKPRMYKVKGQRYLNVFPGFLHVPKSLSEYGAKVHAYVTLIFAHIRDIWCSGNWKVTEYIIKWIAGMSIGKKMYSILYFKSGQGWGKGTITDFLQRFVLGEQLVYKSSDPQTILESFNEQLLGKVLLLLEEMPTEKSSWNSLYRSMKDKISSDIIEIHGKYKIAKQYKNFMSTMVLTNENALRVDNDDRRTVFLDISPARKGDLEYFRKVGIAMKYPGVSEAFYGYLQAIAKAYPDFDGNPPPMTISKQEHIISTLSPLFQFMKEDYLIADKPILPNLPVQHLYNSYKNYCDERKITPLAKVVVARTLSNELGINSTRSYVDGKRTRGYNITKEELCKKFLAKNWIHETDDIDGVKISEAPASDPKALDQFLSKIYPTTSSQPIVKAKVEKIEEPEPDPSKQKHLKTELDTEKSSISMDNLLDELQDYIEELKAISSEPYGRRGSVSSP